ncbi:MAG TPA: dual specificity protein phosphatase [Terriglobales bacterium]|nr:dual specificity protein phosphatase [Terriglobales bacterium]
MTWVTERIALGAAIWSDSNMQTVARSGVTHIIDMQIEFDDTELARPYGIEVLWNGTDDDFQPKPPELFERGVEFGQAALSENGGKLYIHCAAGVHRAAMMTLALLGAMGWETDEAMQVIQGRRPVVDFADVYVQSVEGFLRQRELSRGVEAASDSQDGKNGPSRKSRNKNRI